MKYTTCLICLFIIVESTNGQLNVLRDRIRSTLFLPGVGASCVSESGASNEDLNELMSQKLPSTREGKCLAACIFRRLGIDEDKLKSRLEDVAFDFLNFLKEQNSPLYNTTMNIALKCGTIMYTSDANDICEQAFEMMKCGLQEGLTNGIPNVFSDLLRTNQGLLFPIPSNSMTRNRAGPLFGSQLKRFDVWKLMD